MQGIVDCYSVQVLNAAERLERQVFERSEFCRLVQRNLEPVRIVQSDESQSTASRIQWGTIPLTMNILVLT